MSERNDRELLEDIIECISRITAYTEHVNYDDYQRDYKTQDAVIRNIEIIGEAVKSLSDGLKNRCPGIQWKNIAGTRDKLIHDYFGVNIDIVWSIAKEEIPLLALKLKDILKVLDEESG